MNNIRFQPFNFLPKVIKNIVIINGLAYFTKITFGLTSEIFFNEYLSLHSINSDYFKPYQLITYLFVHANFGHFFFNMLALWMFGSILENVWGERKFIIFYLICGIAAGLSHLTFLWFQQRELMAVLTMPEYQYAYDRIISSIDIPILGASGAVFGCLAAFGYLFPNDEIYIYFLFPIKAKWFVLIYIGLEIVSAFIIGNSDGVGRIAHLGGAFAGFLIVYFGHKKNGNRFKSF